MSVNAYGMPTGVQIPQATDFRQNQTASSRYRFRRILGEGTQAQAPFNIQLSATTDINFRFGAGYVINLAKTRLRICEALRYTVAVNQLYTRAVPPVKAIRLQTSSGVILFDIQNMDAYMNAVYPFSERFSQRHGLPVMNCPTWTSVVCADAGGSNSSIGSTSAGTYPGGTNLTFPTCGPCFGTGSAGDAKANGQNENCAISEPGGPLIVPGIQACSKIATDTVTAQSVISIGVGNGYVQPGQLAAKLAAAVLPGKDMPRQYIPTIAMETAVPTEGIGANFLGSTNYMQWDVPLSRLLPHTVCAALQDLYFGTDLLLTVTLDSLTNRSFVAASTGNGSIVNHPDHVASQAAMTSVTAATSASAAASYYALDMQLATQDNLDLVNSVKQEIAGKGIRIPVQQPFVSIEAGPTVSSSDSVYSRVLRLNIARGASLLKSYSGIMDTAGTTAFPYVNRLLCNLPTSLYAATPADPPTGVSSSFLYPQWKQYRSFLNSVPMSDSSLDPRDQWQRSCDWIKDCFAKTFKSWLQLGGVCVEDFTSGFDLRLTTPEGGLPLANPIDVQIDMTLSGIPTAPVALPAASGYTKREHLWIGIMLKYLSISPAGVTLESV